MDLPFINKSKSVKLISIFYKMIIQSWLLDDSDQLFEDKLFLLDPLI